MKTTIKPSIYLLTFALFSCTVNTELENILPQNTENTANAEKFARKSPIVNTITLSYTGNHAEINNLSAFIVSFDSENLAERKGWDGTVKGGRRTPFHNFIINQSGTILTELSSDDLALGNPAFKPGQPIGGIIVKGGKNPGGQMRVMKTDENGEVELPKEWKEGEYLIQIESKIQNSEFVLTINKEKIKEVTPINMLVNKDGTIRNFYYEEDFQLHNDIAKYLGVEQIVIEKGYYTVDYSDKKDGGNVSLKVKNGGKITGSIIISNGNAKFYEGVDPKGIDCKGFGVACFYNAETGIDKKDIRQYVVKPIIEKNILIGVKILEKKNGLNFINMKKGITQSGIK